MKGCSHVHEGPARCRASLTHARTDPSPRPRDPRLSVCPSVRLSAPPAPRRSPRTATIRDRDDHTPLPCGRLPHEGVRLLRQVRPPPCKTQLLRHRTIETVTVRFNLANAEASRCRGGGEDTRGAAGKGTGRQAPTCREAAVRCQVCWGVVKSGFQMHGESGGRESPERMDTQLSPSHVPPSKVKSHIQQGFLHANVI